VQSVPIANKVVSSNPAYGEVYSIQHYVIKFVSDLRQVDLFSSAYISINLIKYNVYFAVSGFPQWASFILIGCICTFYTFMVSVFIVGSDV
jgi:hypothetical protein